MKFSPTEFWNMTLHEAYLVIDGDEKRQENDCADSLTGQMTSQVA